jgi:hypothetical protein
MSPRCNVASKRWNRRVSLLPERAGGAGQQGSASQAEQDRQLQHRKTAAGFLIGGLRETLLVGGRVGEPEAGAVHHLERTSAQQGPGRGVPERGGGAGRQRFFQDGLRQACPGLAVAARVLIHGGATPQRAQGLHLADGFAARRVVVEHLPEPAPEGAGERVDALATVGAGGRLGQQPAGQAVAQPGFELGERGLLKGAAGVGQPGLHGSQPVRPCGEVGRGGGV